ncbi:hypothetical protein VaNZ11_000949 [Volvox africanus]|uniref:Non-haem dioxygenase N-terminal domain-containing protein n=1 Tax=Volvox africanus TaxID=51714 RepID=A0ABQ5RNI2_9CHLO|nr:hypothetical protein VaNZ11_000949 [Volvox africanus]
MIAIHAAYSPGILFGRRASLHQVPGLTARRIIVMRKASTEDKASGGHSEATVKAGKSVVPAASQLVCIEFKDLVAQKDLTYELEMALGPNGLGAIVIKGVPSYSKLRGALLPLAERIASLPPEVQEKYVDADSSYSFGWSHGKESLANGVLDMFKGSFYANPLVDDQLQPGNGDWLQPWAFPIPADEANPTDNQLPSGTAMPATPYDDTGMPASSTASNCGGYLGIRSDLEVSELRRMYPEYFHKNLWPREEAPELEIAFKDLGRLICAVGCLLAEHCDRYVSLKLGTSPGLVSGVLRRSLNPKARLLHYFAPSETPLAGCEANQQQQQCHPMQQQQQKASGGAAGISSVTGDKEDEQQAWCGLHTDHGSLTGLTAAMYLDGQGREVPSPDPEAGLYIRDRSGVFVRAGIPPDCIAFQVGEALQVHSGGLLMATPHYVRAPRSQLAQGISRNTFAVFMQPDVLERMDCPPGADPEHVAVGQWKPGHTFGEFAAATFQQYYPKQQQQQH